MNEFWRSVMIVDTVSIDMRTNPIYIHKIGHASMQVFLEKYVFSPLIRGLKVDFASHESEDSLHELRCGRGWDVECRADSSSGTLNTDRLQWSIYQANWRALCIDSPSCGSTVNVLKTDR